MAKLQNIIMRGLHADRPSAGTAGRLYYETDTSTFFRDSGSVWEAVEGAGTFVSPLTTVGDIIFEDTGPTAARLAIGASGQVLTVSGGKPAWQTPAAGFSNPMTTQDDLIIGGSSGSPTRLAKGSNSQVLTVVSGHLTWATPVATSSGNTNSNFTNPMSAIGDLIYGESATLVDEALTATISSTAPNYSGTAANTNDGNDATAWLGSTTSDVIVQYDLGSAKTITYFRALQYTSSHRRPIIIEYSSDNSTWAEAYRTGSYPSLDTGVVSLTTSATARYWRVTYVGPSYDNSYGSGVYTFSLYSGLADGRPYRLGVGTSGQILTVIGGKPAWAAATGGGGGGSTASGVLVLQASGIIVPGLAASVDSTTFFGRNYTPTVTEHFDTTTHGLTFSTSPSVVDSNTTMPSHLYVVPGTTSEIFAYKSSSIGTGTFDVRAKVGMGQGNSEWMLTGIRVHATGSNRGMAILVGVSTGATTLYFYTYDSGYTLVNSVSLGRSYPQYLRLTRDSGDYASMQCWYSWDGLGWIHYGTPQNWSGFMNASIDRIGYYIQAYSTQTTNYMYSDWLRIDDFTAN